MNYCSDRGYLVGMSSPLGADPAEYYREEYPQILGCTRLHCRLCGAMVRIEGGWEPGQARERHYECDCSNWEGRWEERGTKHLEPETDEYSLPWSCAGHPVAEFPFELDGMRITRETDWSALLRRAFLSAPERARPLERERAGWALKLYVRLSGTGLEDEVPQAVARLARDPEPRVRGGVLRFLERRWDLPVAEVVEELVAGDRSLFEGIPDPTANAPQSLDELLRVVLGIRVWKALQTGRQVPPQALKLTQREVLRPGMATGLVHAAALASPAWFKKNALNIVRATPRSWHDVLLEFDQPNRPKAAREIALLPEVESAWLWEYLRAWSPEQEVAQAMLAALLARGPGEASPRAALTSAAATHQHSEAFRRFVESVEGPITNAEQADRFNLEALDRLTGDERDQAEELLIARLGDTIDGRVPPALVRLGTSRALTALKDSVERTEGQMKVAVLRAVKELAPNEDPVDELAEVLRTADSYGRVSAASALGQVPGEAADRALFEALADPDEMVRINAVDSLYEKHGLKQWQTPLQSRLNSIAISMRSTLRSARDPAIAALQKILAGLAAGASPEKLGLLHDVEAESGMVQAFLESYRHKVGEPGSWQERFDVNAIRAMSPDEQFWATQMLVSAMEGSSWRKPDPRAVRAMAELGWPVFVAPLSEILSSLSSPMADEVAGALAALAGPSAAP